MSMIEEAMNKIIKGMDIDTNEISDGYHTFGELYEHRIALFIALCHAQKWLCMEGARELINEPWKAKKHSDGSAMEGWFIAGIGQDNDEQITYHLPLSMWDKLDVEEYDKAPEWDGHTPQDVVERLLKL